MKGRVGRPPRPVQERFESKYIKDLSGCWLWQAGKDSNGYGKLQISGKSTGAHRISWELTNGPVPEGMLVLHTCDTPNCVNSNHLFIGTNTDNMRDKVSKGRDFNLNKRVCIRGHAFDEKNTRHHMRPSGEWHRTCRACDALRSRSYRKKRKVNV